MKADEIRRLIINDLFLNMDDDDAEDTLERIDEYAAEVSRERINDAWLRGFNEGRLAHPRKERKEKKCTCGGYPDCICKEQEEL